MPLLINEAKLMQKNATQLKETFEHFQLSAHFVRANRKYVIDGSLCNSRTTFDYNSVQ